jgi:hypothetical protein
MTESLTNLACSRVRVPVAISRRPHVCLILHRFHSVLTLCRLSTRSMAMAHVNTLLEIRSACHCCRDAHPLSSR